MGMIQPKQEKTAQSPQAWILPSVLVTLVLAAVSYYFLLPPLNLHSTELFRFLLIWLLLYFLIAKLFAARAGCCEEEETGLSGYLHFAKLCCVPVTRALLVIVAVFLIGQLLSLPVFRAKNYHDLLTVETGDFAADVEQIPYTEIPMLDASAAVRLGDRKLGELSDMVSQFTVSEAYTQINANGAPVRVTALEYADVFKWFLNQKGGLPAYVQVDMVTQEAEVTQLADLGLCGMRWSPSEYLQRDLDRTLRFRYPTYMFLSPHLEIDEDGTPFWVCPRQIRSIGLFGGTDIIGAVLLNACSGESQYYALSDVPTWVDQVFDAELIAEQYDYYGTYVHGFINSLVGQRNVTVTTEGFNYIAMDDDVYMYSGITSVSSDQSNIGFLLSNQRTKETTYYAAPGAIETSAQASAEGVVQDLGYTATFPLLLNIGGQPTYFLSLKDDADLVKQYAMVNVAQYQIVATGTTVAECEQVYLSLLRQAGIQSTTDTALDAALDRQEVDGVVQEIRSMVLDGNTHWFLRLDDSGTYYAISSDVDQTAALLNCGDHVTLTLSGPQENGLLQEALSVEKHAP